MYQPVRVRTFTEAGFGALSALPSAARTAKGR
jgi:hypothetical protein